MTQQLILDFGLQNNQTFDNYVPGDNVELIEQLHSPEQNNFIFLSGPPSVGKTHLLCAACAAAQHAALIPLTDANTISTDLLSGLDTLPLICIDDIHLIVGNAAWEEAIFHLYNHAKDANQRLIFSSRIPSAKLHFQLQDLTSRITCALTYQIIALSDHDKRRALQQHAQIRGIHLSTASSNYLVNHFSRDMASLLDLLHQLDTASLSAKRKLTIPFIKTFTAQIQKS